MELLDLWETLQPSCYLDAALDLCRKEEASYYIEADAKPPSAVQEAVVAGRCLHKTRQRLFFYVRAVQNGLVDESPRRFFLKVLLTGVGDDELSMHKDIVHRTFGATPHIIKTLQTKVLRVDPFEMSYILMECNVSLQAQLDLVLRRSRDTEEFNFVLLSCFFQCFHGIATLHTLGYQHRDMRLENITSSYFSRTGELHYTVENLHLVVPVAHRDYVLKVAIIDFGLSERWCADTCVNGVEEFLSPNYVFITENEMEMSFSTADDTFGLGLSLLAALHVFVLPKLDASIVRVTESLFSRQIESATTGRHREHLSMRNAKRLTEHAFVLVLLLGLPSLEEFPAFHYSPVGTYFSTCVAGYLRQLSEYNFLATQFTDPTHHLYDAFNLLRKALRWHRHDRIAAKQMLLQPEFTTRFARPRDIDACSNHRHYVWQEAGEI